jgi:hypothetical protein
VRSEGERIPRWPASLDGSRSCREVRPKAFLVASLRGLVTCSATSRGARGIERREAVLRHQQGASHDRWRGPDLLGARRPTTDAEEDAPRKGRERRLRQGVSSRARIHGDGTAASRSPAQPRRRNYAVSWPEPAVSPGTRVAWVGDGKGSIPRVCEDERRRQEEPDRRVQ